MLKYLNVIVFVILLSFLGGLLLYRYMGAAQNSNAVVAVSFGTRIDPPKIIPELALKSSDRSDWPFQKMLNKWTLVYLGYTFCPDICPVTLGYLKTEIKPRYEQLIDGRLQVLFVSVDPERDLDKSTNYARTFDPKFEGVSGSVDEISKLANVFGAYIGRRLNGDPKNYLVDHPGQIFLVDPRGRWVRSFSPPFDKGEILAGLDEAQMIYEGEARPELEDAWLRTPKGGVGSNTALYGNILFKNKKIEDEKILALRSSYFDKVELHRSVFAEGMHRMDRISDIALGTAGKVQLSPGGLHGMFLGLKRKLSDEVVVQIDFERSGSLSYVVPVRSEEGATDEHDHHEMHH